MLAHYGEEQTTHGKESIPWRARMSTHTHPHTLSHTHTHTHCVSVPSLNNVGTLIHTHMVSWCFLLAAWTPVFPHMSCPTAVMWWHGNTCSQAGHASAPSCGVTGMIFTCVLYHRSIQRGHGHAFSRVCGIPDQLCGGLSTPVHTHAGCSVTHSGLICSFTRCVSMITSSQSCKPCSSASACCSDHPFTQVPCPIPVTWWPRHDFNRTCTSTVTWLFGHTCSDVSQCCHMVVWAHLVTHKLCPSTVTWWLRHECS